MQSHKPLICKCCGEMLVQTMRCVCEPKIPPMPYLSRDVELTAAGHVAGYAANEIAAIKSGNKPWKESGQ